MGLMISSIAKIYKDILPLNLFKKYSDYFLYILEYYDFDFQEMHNYSTEFHDSGMSRILNNYQYDFKNKNFTKLVSKTFHSTKFLTSNNIFGIRSETSSEKITPTFLFTNINPNQFREIETISPPNKEFIFLNFLVQNRDANKVPQLVNEIFSNSGLAVSRCATSIVKCQHENVYIFDYHSTNIYEKNLLQSIKEDTLKILENQETLESVIATLTNEQTNTIVNEIMTWISTVTVELNSDLNDKLTEIKKTDDLAMKLKLSIPFIQLLGINLETEFNIKSWTKKMYNKYEFKIFKLIGEI